MSTELEAQADEILDAADTVRRLEYRVDAEATMVANLVADSDTTSGAFRHTVNAYRTARNELAAARASYSDALNSN